MHRQGKDQGQINENTRNGGGGGMKISIIEGTENEEKI